MLERGARAARTEPSTSRRLAAADGGTRPRGHRHLPRALVGARGRDLRVPCVERDALAGSRRIGTRLGACSRSVTASEPLGSGKGSAFPRPSSRRRSARSTSAPSRRRTSTLCRPTRTRAAFSARTPTISASTARSTSTSTPPASTTPSGKTSRGPRARPRRPRRERTIERRAVVLALAGIAVVAALVIGAWKYGNVGVDASRGSTSTTRRLTF